MNFAAIIISTYGSSEWEALAHERALPSAKAQDVEVLIGHDPNGTVSSVRNALGAKAENAENLLYLDADDELAPGFIQALERAYEQAGGDDGTPRLFTPAVSYVVNGRRQGPRFPPGSDLTKDNYLVVGTLVPRRLFLRVGGFSEYPHGFEDWSLWAKCWKAGVEIVRVPEAVYIAYVDMTSKHRQAWRNRKEQVAMHEKIRGELFPELYVGTA